MLKYQNKLKNVSKFAHEIANAKNTNDLFGALGKHPKQSVNIDDKLSDTKKKLLTITVCSSKPTVGTAMKKSFFFYTVGKAIPCVGKNYFRILPEQVILS